jgi:hypothetical protein
MKRSILGRWPNPFEGRAFVLFVGPTDSGFRLALEPLINGGLSAGPASAPNTSLVLSKPYRKVS